MTSIKTATEEQSSLIHHFLEGSAKLYPDKTALIHEDIRASYLQINNTANSLAYGLSENGIKNGDRVVLIFENCLEYVISYYGILKAGAVVVPLSSDLKPDGLRPLLEELEPKAIISTTRFERLLRATDISDFKLNALIIKKPKIKWEAAPCSIIDWDDFVSSGNDTSNFSHEVAIKPSDLASIIYTSGSTGTPKGVMLSHGNIVANTASICEYLELEEKDIQMVVLPFFYVMGKSLLNTHFSVGGTIVINNKFAFPATVINQMIEENVTGFSGVPSTYAYLLHRSPLKKLRDKLASLRYCSQAGGHMAKQVKIELRQTLPKQTKIFVMYGATEASARLTYLESDRYEEKIDSIGRPIPGVKMKILDEKGAEVSNGQTGELVGAGPNIMQGYWKDKENTEKVLDQNGYHTGDLGFQDEEGFIYVTGRRDNLLKVGGHRINSQEVEDALISTDQILETIVVGVPDTLLGNKIIALVVPMNEDCDENLIMSLCSEKLPKYKLPSEIIKVRALPKSASGKVDREKCLGIISN